MMIETCTKSTATTPHIPLITLESRMTPPMTSTACENSKPKPASTVPEAMSCAAKMPSRLGMFESDAQIRTARLSP